MLRRLRRLRHKRLLLIFFGGLSIIIFLAKDSASQLNHSCGDDSAIALKSQIGYLKNKLAQHSINKRYSSVAVKDNPLLPFIYVIMPTYARPTQKADLTRLCYTFLLVPNLHWIVVEDARAKTRLVSDLLSSCGVSYTQLNEPTPADWKLGAKEASWRKPRGVVQRNEGLAWVRDNLGNQDDGVIYFGDDDNTYSLELFEEMRHTSRVSVWPVGLVGGLKVEGPRVKEGKVVGWNAVWSPKRPFAIDMAGFAVSLPLLLKSPKAKFAYEVRRGYQESEFLKHLVSSLDELEPKAEDCTKVLVWHTKTQKVKLDMEAKLKDRGDPPSDDGVEV